MPYSLLVGQRLDRVNFDFGPAESGITWSLNFALQLRKILKGRRDQRILCRKAASTVVGTLGTMHAEATHTVKANTTSSYLTNALRDVDAIFPLQYLKFSTKLLSRARNLLSTR